MNVLLSLSVCSALLTLTCGGNHETQSDYEDTITTPSYDYDYNVTFDYYFETGDPRSSNNASGTPQLSPLVILGLTFLHIWIRVGTSYRQFLFRTLPRPAG